MEKQRKSKTVKRGLGELDQQEKDYMENLAKTLLQIQNADPPKTAGRKGGKTPHAKKGKE